MMTVESLQRRRPIRQQPQPAPAQPWPVVVVGAGPAGLASAITLARAGIRVLVLNRRMGASAVPRATVLSLRTMEHLRSWGLEDAIRAGGNDVELQMLATPTLAAAQSGTPIAVGYPTRAESELISPTRPACVPQDHLENVLLDHLHTLPTADLQLGVAFEQLDRTPTGYALTLRDVVSGDQRIAEARYLIGADGPRSLVREQVGIAVQASSPQLRSESVVFQAPLWEVVGDQRFLLYSVDDPVPGTLLPGGVDDRWVYGSATDLASELDADQLVTRIRQAVGIANLPVRIGRISVFHFIAALADRFRADRVFLAGDAAHRATPRGGTGLNTAFADGFDLGWKLAWVLRGWAPDTLLDSYEAERRPIAEHHVTRSLDPMGSRRSAGTELPFDLGGRIAHHWIGSDHHRISTLDLAGPGLTRLVAQRSGPASSVSLPRSTPPVTERLLDRRTAALVGADRPGGLLVRPDSVPWRG